jgi:hypothetical protein
MALSTMALIEFLDGDLNRDVGGADFLRWQRGQGLAGGGGGVQPRHSRTGRQSFGPSGGGDYTDFSTNRKKY